MNPDQQTRLTMVFALDNDKKATKSLQNIKGTATDEQLIQIATALATLQEGALAEVTRVNSHAIM